MSSFKFVVEPKSENLNRDFKMKARTLSYWFTDLDRDTKPPTADQMFQSLDQVIEQLADHVRDHLTALVEEYWSQYYTARGHALNARKRFDWQIGVRMKETRSGGRLEWFVIHQQGKGKKALLATFSIKGRNTTDVPELVRATAAERKLVRTLRAREKELAPTLKAIETICTKQNVINRHWQDI